MHLTKSEQQIMEIFWQADHPMAQTEVVSTCVDRKWKERSIFSMLNSLMEKGVLKEVGFVRSGKTYARTFEPAMSHAEYLAEVIVEQLRRISSRDCWPPCSSGWKSRRHSEGAARCGTGKWPVKKIQQGV